MYCNFCIKGSTPLPRPSLLSPQSVVSQCLPAGTWHFPNLGQQQFVVLVCPTPLESALPSHSPIFPVFYTLLLLPWVSWAVQTRHLGPTWADQVFYYHPFQQLLQLSSDTIPVFPPFSHFLLCPLFYANFLLFFFLELIWGAGACCGCFPLSHICALLAYSDSRFDHLGTGSIYCGSITTSIQSLGDWPFYLLSPDGPSQRFRQPWEGVLTLWQDLLECPNKFHSFPKIHNAAKWRLCVPVHDETQSSVCASGIALTQAFLASKRLSDGQQLLP